MWSRYVADIALLHRAFVAASPDAHFSASLATAGSASARPSCTSRGTAVRTPVVSAPLTSIYIEGHLGETHPLGISLRLERVMPITLR
jgi:hypothetical protein